MSRNNIVAVLTPVEKRKSFLALPDEEKARALVPGGEFASERVFLEKLREFFTSLSAFKVFCASVEKFACDPKNKRLVDCTPQSVKLALISLAQSKLALGSQCYFVSYGKQLSFQMGYKGLIQMAYASGEVESVSAKAVFKGDAFQYIDGTSPVLTWERKYQSTQITKVFCIISLVKGGSICEVMTTEEIEAHKNQYSKAATGDAWRNSWAAMALKTIVVKALKFAPFSVPQLESELDFIDAPSQPVQVVASNPLGITQTPSISNTVKSDAQETAGNLQLPA